jgi:hypothetical protein
MGGRRSCLVTLFLLCSLFSLLPFTADDYVDCTDPFPDELLDILGLIERPVNGIPIPHVSLEFIPKLTYTNPATLLHINATISLNILPATIIRI